MTAATWFVILAALAVLVPYLCGISPRTRRQWLYVMMALTFLAWILPLMASLRSR